MDQWTKLGWGEWTGPATQDPRVYAQQDPSTRVYFNMFINEMLNVRERLHGSAGAGGGGERVHSFVLRWFNSLRRK